jgi:hypothetical protein
MDRENLNKIVKKCNNFSDVSYKLYGNNSAGNRYTIKKYIDKYQIDISHFTFKGNWKNSRNNFKKRDINEILSNNSYYDTTNLKERLYKEGLKERKCELCGQDEKWQGKKMSLILDHINGVNKDNRIINLRIVCPNCNATLPTHGGKNNKRLISSKKEKKYLSEDELKEVNKERGLKQRSVDRPEYEELKHEVKKHGYLATGRKYGVSDNAIRKWIRFYEKYGI